MASLDRIATLGFKRWHERQLIEGHAWLVTCFLAIIAVASGIEVFGHRTPDARAVGMLLILGGIAVGMLAWHRYRNMLAIAECMSARAVCPACHRYSRFRIVESGPKPMPRGIDFDLETLLARAWFRAECGCGWRWSL